jgi:hypothetical protein
MKTVGQRRLNHALARGISFLGKENAMATLPISVPSVLLIVNDGEQQLCRLSVSSRARALRLAHWILSESHEAWACIPGNGSGETIIDRHGARRWFGVHIGWVDQDAERGDVYDNLPNYLKERLAAGAA